jgi:hypothetical protein
MDATTEKLPWVQAKNRIAGCSPLLVKATKGVSKQEV